MSVELMTAPAKDKEHDRLQAIKKQLDDERQRFTETAIRLGKEKAVLEVLTRPFVVNITVWANRGPSTGRTHQFPR
jgi:hypothetical protein